MPKTTRRRVHKSHPKRVFDKYDLYMESVQSPDVDVLFYRKVYKELKKKEPKVMREDFCGTFALCTEWVKLSKHYKAYGIDLDPEPIEYGKSHYLSKLKEHEQKRITILEQDVLHKNLPKSDIVAAMNFSYFIFHKREQMKEYFRNVYSTLNSGGIFLIDVFGGSDCCDENEETTNLRKFKYFWHQRGFDPVTAKAKFNIHFQIKGQKKTEDVFTYDWRMWSIPELRETLEEVGFKKTHIYWEGTNKKGEGNGIFTRTEKGEECEAWIAYIASER